MNTNASQKAAPTAKDWALLGRLFADETGVFRHHLGLAKSDAPDFYAPTAEAESIRAQKQALLDSPDAGQYLVESPGSRAACEEFAGLFCPTAVRHDTVMDYFERIRAVTLALEPDWLLLAPPDWRLVCAGVCFPTRWSLVGKAGQPLPQIHAAVPDLQRQIGRQIDVFFSRMSSGEGWGRANWGLSTSDERNQHPSLPCTAISGETPITRIYVRVESQHLCKLPVTGVMAFGIRILNFPLAGVAKHSAIAAGLKQQLRTMPGEMARYKGIPENLWERW